MRGTFFLALAAFFASGAQAETPPCPAPNASSLERDARGTTPQHLQEIIHANAIARQRPHGAGFSAARQVYAYAPGALYLLQASPAYVSTILLEPGETLIDIAAGDTSRWMVSDTMTETERAPRTIVLVKPQAPDLRTNIVLVTDRRAYLVEAVSEAGDAYLAQIAWCYPAASSQPRIDPVGTLNWDYRIRTVRGRKPAWFPARVYDDGRHTWIEFSADADAGDLPPLFIISPEGAELVNYRVQAGPRRYMVDRLFDRAELRVGRRGQVIVRIDRRGGRP